MIHVRHCVLSPITEVIDRNTTLKKLPLVATEARNIQGAKSINNKALVRITDFLCGSAGKESACNFERPGFDSWVGNVLWRRERLPTPFTLS